MSKSVIQHPGVITSVKSQRRWNGGPARARERPGSLALSAFKLRKLHRLQEKITDVHTKAVARWPHPQAAWPRRGRLAPLCSPSSLGFAWKLSLTATTAFNRCHVLHLLRTDLGRAINKSTHPSLVTHTLELISLFTF